MSRKQHIIVRSRSNSNESMEILVDVVEETFAVIKNKGMEILIIDKSYSADFELTHLDDKPIAATEDEPGITVRECNCGKEPLDKYHLTPDDKTTASGPMFVESKTDKENQV